MLLDESTEHRTDSHFETLPFHHICNFFLMFRCETVFEPWSAGLCMYVKYSFFPLGRIGEWIMLGKSMEIILQVVVPLTDEP